MDLDLMMICRPWWYTASLLGMFVFPFAVLPLLRRPGVYRTTAPLLFVLAPLFHGTFLGYMGLRSLFIGIAVGGRVSPVVIDAAWEDIRAMLGRAAVCSAAVLIAALWCGRRVQVRMARGRAAAIVALAAGLLLFATLFVAGMQLVMPAAYASAALVLFSLCTAVWLAARTIPADVASPLDHRVRL